MDPEQYLRRAAAKYLAPMQRAPEKMHADLHRGALAGLHGSLDVLVELGMIDRARGSELIREVLSETTRALLDRGELEEVRVSMQASARVMAHRSRRRSLESALDRLNSEGVVTESEYREMRERLEGLPDED